MENSQSPDSSVVELERGRLEKERALLLHAVSPFCSQVWLSACWLLNMRGLWLPHESKHSSLATRVGLSSQAVQSLCSITEPTLLCFRNASG